MARRREVADLLRAAQSLLSEKMWRFDHMAFLAIRDSYEPAARGGRQPDPESRPSVQYANLGAGPDLVVAIAIL